MPMKDKIRISGFADEISPDFTKQLETVTSLGMHYISLRSADGKGIADFTEDEVRDSLLPRMERFGVKVSSIGSPIGKVGVEDEAGFAVQLQQLERLCRICKLLDCRVEDILEYVPDPEEPEAPGTEETP